MDLECPNCGYPENSTDINQTDVCKECGFPFICEFTYPTETAPLDKLRNHRFVLLWTVLLFALFQIFGSFYYASQEVYNGQIENLVNYVTPALDIGIIKLEGESNQTQRVRIALNFIRRNDYDLYKSIVNRIPKIEVTPRDDFFITGGSKMDIIHIGGFVQLPEGKITLKRSTVLGIDPSKIYDRTIITIASVIIHEYEHARRFDLGISEKGAAEEIAVEQSVYDFLVECKAPPGMIDEKKKYLKDPYLKKYNRWYSFSDNN